MATHSSILAWRIPMDRGAWQATVQWGCKGSDMTKHTHTGPRYLTVEDGAGVGKKETGFELGAGSYL